jgi:hypothetical protein
MRMIARSADFMLVVFLDPAETRLDGLASGIAVDEI